MSAKCTSDVRNSGASSKYRYLLPEWIRLKIPETKPFTPYYVYSYYVPLAGALSYSLISVTKFCPEVSSWLSSKHNPAILNSLIFNSHLGSGFYLYSRKHLAEAPTYYRIMYSVYGALVFNFSSVLLWAVTKTLMPDNSLSLCMLTIGKEYLNYVDSKIESNE
ncbi:uncharacterized protein LOC143254388 [Tachypleus tridentatus]|uniref:uncharacterized protein LOC143254388 n=1 Tax=Tachypleus tridentatus TaxID=6853 RepID=UPI003FD054EC